MHLTPELGRWITEQLARGCQPADMIEALITVGHDPALAREALERFSKGPVANMAQVGEINPAPLSSTGVPEPLPGPLAQGAHKLEAVGKSVNVLLSLKSPRLIVFEGVLSDAECAALILESKPKLLRSQTVDRDSGGTELNAARTSEGTYFHHTETPLLSCINERLAALLRWPLENAEPLQILHYGVGAEYQPHYDYFDRYDSGTAKLIAQGGQRVATLIIYLNDPEAGGATIFPDIGLEIAAVMGNAVFFSYERPDPGTRSLHGGTPVTRGEKWIATRWLRERAYR